MQQTLQLMIFSKLEGISISSMRGLVVWMVILWQVRPVKMKKPRQADSSGGTGFISCRVRRYIQYTLDMTLIDNSNKIKDTHPMRRRPWCFYHNPTTSILGKENWHAKDVLKFYGSSINNITLECMLNNSHYIA